MKKIFGIFIISLLLYGTILQAQQVTAEIIAPVQSGSHNYFGVRVTLDQTYGQDVIITGYIFDDGGGFNANHPFTLTVPTGELTAETATNFYETDPTASAALGNLGILFTYAGVTIIYEFDINILKFSNFTDVNTVLDQLDLDYDNNYNNYDSHLDTSLTVVQLDSLDELNGFDPRITFKNFENLFPGYNSKRAQIKGIESTWLYNNLSGTNPADVDITYDDSQNAICNTDYSFKIGNDLYHLTSDGMYINGILDSNGGSAVIINPIQTDVLVMNKPLPDNSYKVSGPMITESDLFHINRNLQVNKTHDLIDMTVCKSNKRNHLDFKYDNESKMFELEVAIHSIVYRTGIHGKVIHFKKKNNGHWKRSRQEMAVGCGGKVYTGNCTYLEAPILRQPNSGFKKREEQKAKRHNAFTIPGNNTIWKTYSGEFAASFDSPVGPGVLTLNF